MADTARSMAIMFERPRVPIEPRPIGGVKMVGSQHVGSFPAPETRCDDQLWRSHTLCALIQGSSAPISIPLMKPFTAAEPSPKVRDPESLTPADITLVLSLSPVLTFSALLGCRRRR